MAFRLIETRVDNKGGLREPFFRLPISIMQPVRESPPELDLLPGVKPGGGADHWLCKVAWRRHPCCPPGYFGFGLLLGTPTRLVAGLVIRSIPGIVGTSMALISHTLTGFAVAAARPVAILVIITLDAGPGVGALNGCGGGGLD